MRFGLGIHTEIEIEAAEVFFYLGLDERSIVDAFAPGSGAAEGFEGFFVAALLAVERTQFGKGEDNARGVFGLLGVCESFLPCGYRIVGAARFVIERDEIAKNDALPVDVAGLAIEGECSL